jgi:hypothetical protein
LPDESPEEVLTIPAGAASPKRVDLLVQTPVRLHQHTHSVLKVMLKKDQLSLQKFIAFCVRAYLDADPHFIRFLKNYRQLDQVPTGTQEKHVLSHRERAKIFDEIGEVP